MRVALNTAPVDEIITGATTRAVPSTHPAAHYPSSTRRSKLGPSAFQFHVLLTSYETLRDDLPLLGNGCLIASDGY